VILLINKNRTEIKIGENKVFIEDRYTLVQGKFKLNQFHDYYNDDYLQIQENLDLVPVEKFIKVISNESNSLFGLTNFTKILDLLSGYSTIVENNLEIYLKYSKNVELLYTLYKLIYFSAKKKILYRELELSKIRKFSSDILATVDLMKTLTESINNNKVRLAYIKEDYFQRKNQIDKIKKDLTTYETLIQEQSQKKKNCFNQINKITRQLEGSKTENEDDSFLRLGIDTNLTNSEKIRALQKKAKDTQYEINKIRLRSKQSQAEFEELSPNYEIYRNDYEEILEAINKEEKRLRQVQKNYENELRENKDIQFGETEELISRLIRPSLEIEQEIINVESEWDNLSFPSDLNKENLPSNVPVLIEKFKEIDTILRVNDEKINISATEEEIEEIFEHFRIFENNIKDVESITNKFLKAIQLRIQFNLVTNQMSTAFLIKTDFTRNYKNRVNFENLTTPEKIFFIISFYISCKVLANSKNIIFSNLFVLPKYNKGGSIYRTFRKIIPLFETDENLSDVSIILLMSNLELKKDIEKLKIIKINER
jgi:chromosome segregation ATPase